MARLRDIPHVARNVGPWTFAKRIYNQTMEDNLLSWAAALAYSWLFALFPLLIFCLSLVPLLPGAVKPDAQTILAALEDVLITGGDLTDAAVPVLDEVMSPENESADGVGGDGEATTRPTTMPAEGTAEEELTDEPLAVEPTMEGPPVAAPDSEPAAADAPARPPPPANVISDTVVTLVNDLINRPPSGLWTVSLSLVIALFTASGGMAMTMAGIDKCYDVRYEKMRPVYKSRPIAMLLTVVLVALILVALVILPIGEAILAYIAREDVGGVELGWIAVVGRPLRLTLGALVLFAALGITYKFGPSVKTRLHLFSPGSIFAVAMWFATGYGFRFYIESLGAADSYARTYGAVAGVAFLMLLFYLNALFLLIGAEINAEVDFIRLGIKSGELPEEQETAPIPPYQLDEEDRELKAELEERRSVDLQPEEEQALRESLDAGRS